MGAGIKCVNIAQNGGEDNHSQNQSWGHIIRFECADFDSGDTNRQPDLNHVENDTMFKL